MKFISLCARFFGVRIFISWWWFFPKIGPKNPQNRRNPVTTGCRDDFWAHFSPKSDKIRPWKLPKIPQNTPNPWFLGLRAGKSSTPTIRGLRLTYFPLSGPKPTLRTLIPTSRSGGGIFKQKSERNGVDLYFTFFDRLLGFRYFRGFWPTFWGAKSPKICHFWGGFSIFWGWFFHFWVKFSNFSRKIFNIFYNAQQILLTREQQTHRSWKSFITRARRVHEQLCSRCAELVETTFVAWWKWFHCCERHECITSIHDDNIVHHLISSWVFTRSIHPTQHR